MSLGEDYPAVVVAVTGGTQSKRFVILTTPHDGSGVRPDPVAEAEALHRALVEALPAVTYGLLRDRMRREP